MDTDDVLRRAGEQWRAQHNTPAQLPDVEESELWSRVIPAALAVAIIVVGTFVILRGQSGGGLGAASPTISNSATPVTSSVLSPTDSPSPSRSLGSAASSPSGAPSASAATTGRAADCRAGDLTASVDDTRTGATAGVENVVILFRNTGSAPCWLGGLPRLWGVDSSGHQARLPFAPSADPAYADPGPAAGPGVVAPGGHGALHLTMQVNACAKASPAYVKLRVELHPGDGITIPYPAQLTVSGCFGNEAQAGPVVA